MPAINEAPQRGMYGRGGATETKGQCHQAAVTERNQQNHYRLHRASLRGSLGIPARADDAQLAPASLCAEVSSFVCVVGRQPMDSDDSLGCSVCKLFAATGSCLQHVGLRSKHATDCNRESAARSWIERSIASGKPGLVRPIS